MKSLIIIGMGLAGASLLVNLVELVREKACNTPLEIILMDKDAIDGRGLAYRTSYDCNILNTPAYSCGLVKGMQDEFYEWLKKNNFSEQYNRTHPPRWLYGAYVESKLLDSIKLASTLGISIKKIQTEITNIQYIPITQQYCVEGTNTLPLFSDSICLCIGSLPSEPYKNLSNFSQYYSNPYIDRFPKDIDKEKEVLIIGSRLSAIDAVLMLEESGFKKTIYCTSRVTQLPYVRAKAGYLPKKYLTKSFIKEEKQLSLKNILYLMSKELYELGYSNQSLLRNIKRRYSSIEFLKSECSKAKNQRNWQSLFYHDDLLLNEVWQKLDHKSQKKVANYYYSLFLLYRAAIPEFTAQKLISLLEEKRLIFIKGIKEVFFKEEENSFFVTFKKGIAPLTVSQVVNATGSSHNILSTKHELINNLLNNGLIKPNKFNGIEVNSNYYYSTNRYENKTFYVLGSLTYGVDILTNLIEYLVETSYKIASHILNH